MTDIKLTQTLQQFPELNPPRTLWGRIHARISPRSKLPNPWYAMGLASAIFAVACLPFLTPHTTNIISPEMVALAEMVEETEQKKQEILRETALLTDSSVLGQGLLLHVDSMDTKIHENRTLKFAERQQLLEQQLQSLRSLQYIQRQNATQVRRVSFQ